MRKRTKILLAIASAALLACGAGTLCFAMIAATTSFFDIAILGGVLTAGLLTTTGTICAVSARIRKKMLKVQTESAAQLLESKLETDSTKVNTKELANNITKSNEVMVTNNIMGPLNDEGLPKNNPQRLYEQKRMLEGRRTTLIKQGKTKQASTITKRIEKIEKALDNTEYAPSSSRYSYKSIITNENGTKIEDLRNQISCLTSSARKEFETFIESREAIENRVSENARNSYGYSVSVNFKNGTQKTFARSNSADNMEQCELILLREAKRELGSGNITSDCFPIKLKRKQFKKGSKVADGSELTIQNEQELDKRIDLLTGYIANPEEYKSNSNKYVERTYIHTEKEQTKSDDGREL